MGVPGPILRTLRALRGRRLAWTDAERRAAAQVFGPRFDLDRVCLYDGGWASWGSTRAVGEAIYVARSRQLCARREEPALLSLLVHELVHVWQYRRVGWRYAVGSLTDQLRAFLRGGDRHGAYVYTLHADRGLQGYGFEQQAQMIQDWYERTSLGRLDATVRYCLNWHELGAEEADRIVAGLVRRALRGERV